MHVDCSRRFCLGISHMYIPYSNQINPLYCILFPYFSAPLLSAAFSAFSFTIFLHKCNVFQYYSFSIILFFFSCLPVVPSERLTVTITCVYDHVYIYVYIYFTSLASTYEGKHDLCLSVWLTSLNMISSSNGLFF
jgi:hypothetical protein